MIEIQIVPSDIRRRVRYVFFDRRRVVIGLVALCVILAGLLGDRRPRKKVHAMFCDSAFGAPYVERLRAMDADVRLRLQQVLQQAGRCPGFGRNSGRETCRVSVCQQDGLAGFAHLLVRIDVHEWASRWWAWRPAGRP